MNVSINELSTMMREEPDSPIPEKTLKEKKGHNLDRPNRGLILPRIEENPLPNGQLGREYTSKPKNQMKEEENHE